MSLPTFETTFERTCQIIAARYCEPEVFRILEDFRKRANTNNQDPCSNRELIVDCRVDSQMLNVPESLYSTVVQELRNYRLLHVWVRAKCPNTEDVIIETRNEDPFRRALGRPCPHCGQDHSSLAYEFIEYFFAINFSLSTDKLRVFELVAKGAGPPKESTRTKVHTKLSLWRRIQNFFYVRDDSAVEATARALEENRPIKVPPTTNELLWKLWTFSAAWWLVTLAICLSLIYLAGLRTEGLIAGGLSFVVYSILAYLTWRTIYYRYPVQRRMLTGTQVVGGLALSKGALGISFNWSAEEGRPITQFFEFGQTDVTFVWAGTAIVIAGFICVAIMQCFERPIEP